MSQLYDILAQIKNHPNEYLIQSCLSRNMSLRAERSGATQSGPSKLPDRKQLGIRQTSLPHLFIFLKRKYSPTQTQTPATSSPENGNKKQLNSLLELSEEAAQLRDAESLHQQEKSPASPS